MEFFESATEWFSSGLPQFFIDLLGWFVAKLTILYLYLQIVVMDVAQAAASDILDSYDVSQKLQDLISTIDPQITSTMNFFGLFECINILLNSALSSRILRMFGF